MLTGQERCWTMAGDSLLCVVLAAGKDVRSFPSFLNHQPPGNCDSTLVCYLS